jgi:UDP-N-acetylglucosamine 2-epimerase (hydrolysing)
MGAYRKRVVFLTGTRADFGKVKSLITALLHSQDFEVNIFATGMHMNAKYGYTVMEIESYNFPNIYKYINHPNSNSPDLILSNTINGFGNYIKQIEPDLIVVHGDRIEALAGALVGSLNNVFVAHIEGGEISGTIDESIRHAISKLSHAHFVANTVAKKRLIQLGEKSGNIFVIGSPDIDIMHSQELPTLQKVRDKYQIFFDRFAILVFHPVTTELDKLSTHANVLIDAVIKSKKKFVLVYPNNDLGSDIILDIYNSRLSSSKQVRIFPSIRFEYFLTLLQNSLFVIGNSSLGVREAPYYGIPSINIGTRQNNRTSKLKIARSIYSCDFKGETIYQLIQKFSRKPTRYKPTQYFGAGQSDKKFLQILQRGSFWKTSMQKNFLDLDF